MTSDARGRDGGVREELAAGIKRGRRMGTVGAPISRRSQAARFFARGGQLSKRCCSSNANRYGAFRRVV